jgi:hypothetical protein
MVREQLFDVTFAGWFSAGRPSVETVRLPASAA